MKNEQAEEELINDLVDRIKNDPALLHTENSESIEYAGLIQTLISVPKAKVPVANFARIKNQVLDRISIPEPETVTSGNSFFQVVPRFLKIGAGVIGSFLILSSLAIGASVTALESIPGQPIYPLKKVVENIQLQMASDEVERTNLQIKFANNRLEELEKVLEQSKQGKVSGEAVQKIVESTLKDVAKTTSSISQTSAGKDQQPVQILTKIVDLSNKQTALLQTATIQSEGEIKIELEKALDEAIISQERAIENIEKAGLQVESNPIVIEEKSDEPEEVTAKGKITAVTTTYINIGNVRFLLTKDTKFANIKQADLKIDLSVEIKGIITDGKTYASEISSEIEAEESETESPTIDIDEPDSTQNP